MVSTLFDKQETDDAIQQGLDNADEEWKSLALQAVFDCCVEKDRFTADDIRFVLTDDQAKTHDRRAMGGIMKKAQKNGWCKATGVHIKSKFTHGHLHQVWESLIKK